jgi:hypothetical protein
MLFYFKKSLFFLFFIAFYHTASAQYLDGMAVKWRGDMREWTIWNDSIEGTLRIRWTAPLNPTEWAYEFGTLHGTIKRKWRDDPTLWELTADNGELLTARMIYGTDSREWRITDNNNSIEWRTRYTNNPSDWTLPNASKCGEFSAFTPYINDFQEWNTTDKNDCLSFNVKLMMTFLAMFHSQKWK